MLWDYLVVCTPSTGIKPVNDGTIVYRFPFICHRMTPRQLIESNKTNHALYITSHLSLALDIM